MNAAVSTAVASGAAPANAVRPAAEPCYCALARRASRVLTDVYERELAPHGITLPQYSLLRVSSVVGPLTISEFAARLRLDRTTLGRNVKLLEKSGLIALAENSEDQRERLVTLTAEGARVLGQAANAWRTAQAKVKRGVSKEKLQALQQLVAEIDGLDG